MNKEREALRKELKNFNKNNHISEHGNPIDGWVWSNEASVGGGITTNINVLEKKEFINKGRIEKNGGSPIDAEYYADIDGVVNTLLPESKYTSTVTSSGGLSATAQSAAGLVNAATELQKALYNAYDHAASQAVLQLRTMTLIMGKLEFKDFYCTKISWKFNFEQVDSNGYPLSGTVTFGNIKRPLMPNSGQVYGMMGGMSDKESTKLDQWQKDLLAKDIENQKINGV
jgi:hypothetical protein